MFLNIFRDVRQQDAVQDSFPSANSDMRVVFHYGVPSTASILAFDNIQRLLAVGTLDGRIKVFGGDNIEGTLISPKQASFKNLEFLENQGFLASVSSDNEIQVWNLKSKQIASALQWESIITAFSIIYGTSYILLIAYENGLMVLWDAFEDRIVLIRGHKDIELKRKIVASYPNDPRVKLSDDKLDHQEEDKEISSVSWASNDGSVVVVGYVDGDIMFWDLSTADFPLDQQVKRLSNNVVKLQLSSADRRLPIVVQHWCANKSSNNSGGKLFVYGGHEIGSEEALTKEEVSWRQSSCVQWAKDGDCVRRPLGRRSKRVLSERLKKLESSIEGLDCPIPTKQTTLKSCGLPIEKKGREQASVLSIDWSRGIENLKCTGRIDVTLHASFADMVLLSSDCHTGGACDMLFVLTSAGQLDLYDNDCLSSMMSHQEKKTSAPTMQYPILIPTLEPHMSTARLDVVCQDVKSFSAMFKVNDVKIGNANVPVSALGFCPDTLHLAVGDESGVVRLYGLIKSSDDITLHFVTENGTEVHNTHQGDGPHCKAVFSLQNSAVYSLQFANLGGKLVVGYEHGQVAMFDISSPSILFLIKPESTTSLAVVSMNAKFSDSSLNNPQESVSDISDNPGMGLVFVMTRDAHFVAIDSMTGNMVCSRTMNPRVKSNAISMHIIGNISDSSAENLSSNSPQKSNSGMQPIIQSENAQVEVEIATTVENSYFGQITLNSLILLCYESELSLHSLNFVIEGSSKYVRKVNLVQQCCWTTTFKKDEKECVLVLANFGSVERKLFNVNPQMELQNQHGEDDIRGKMKPPSLRLQLRQPPKGAATKAKGDCNEGGFPTLLLMLMAIVLERGKSSRRIPESFPCLHDEVLAAAVDASASLSPNHNERQVQFVQARSASGASAFFVNIAKNFKAGKADQNANQEVHTDRLENLKRLFSNPPFLKSSSSTVDKEDPFALDIDDIILDEPVVFSSPRKNDIIIDKSDKGKGTDRQKLLEDTSTDSKPKARTAEEIKAKYRKTPTGDAAAAAALARDKLAERKEKLQLLEQRTEELQNGAQDFASMAAEIRKRMENRKWWQL
ncbi:Syntaxin-binding protein 5-like protein, partial [Mucuna pruriens]